MYINYNYNFNPNVYKLLKNISKNKECICFEDKYLKLKQGFNDPNITNSLRISQILNNNYLGGRVVFGNNNIPYKIDYLGSIEGQPGGSYSPLRNQF